MYRDYFWSMQRLISLLFNWLSYVSVTINVQFDIALHEQLVAIDKANSHTSYVTGKLYRFSVDFR